ncbi:MAG TPA: tripartite tricarboxylate transporter substrate-binding protein [Alphaproteobacteria bacterium]
MFAPAHTPREIVRRLNAETNKIIADPVFRAHYLVRQTIEPTGGPPESFAAFLRRDRARYAELVKMAEIRPE